MRSFLVSVGLCLFVCGVYAQGTTSWQSAADRYLQTVISGDPAFEAPDQLEILRVALEKDFNERSQDIQLTQLLTVLSYDQSSAQAAVYFEKVIKTYSQSPIEKALFLMDCAISMDRDKPEVRMFMQEAIELFETAKDTSIAYINALNNFGALLVELKDYKRAYQYYNMALKRAEQNPGKDSELYSSILNGTAVYYSVIGNAELAMQYSVHAKKNRAEQLGINKPYHRLFKEKLLLPEGMAGKNTTVANKMRIALLYRYSTYDYMASNVYRTIAAQSVYEEALRLMKTGKVPLKDQAAFTLDKGILELNVDNYAEAEKDLGAAVKVYRDLSSKSGDDLILFYTSLNLLGTAYYESGLFEKALNCYNEISAGFQKSGLTTGEWNDRILHNLILTSEKTNSNDKLQQLLSRYTTTEGITISLYWEERMMKYGDILFNIGRYAEAFLLYTRAYDHYWDKAREKYYDEKKEALVDDQGNEMTEALIVNQDQVLVNIGVDELVNEIHPYRPMNEEYTQLLFKLARAAFLTRDYNKASEFTIAYINEFYTQYERANFAYNHGTDLYEIYRLKEELFPAYDLFQNILMADTLSSEQVMRENRMRAFTQVLDSKANLQYEYRHMRSVIEGGKDEKLKSAFKDYLAKREELGRLKLSSGADSESVEALTIAIDTLRTYLSGKTALFTPWSERFVFWKDIQKTLDRNEAAIEMKRFHRYDSGKWTDDVIYAAYIITPISTHPEVVFVQNGTFLEGKALKFYQNSIQSKTEDINSYNWYWKPLQGKLPGIYKAFFSPEGVYNQLNILTLFNPESKRYLAEELQAYQLIYTKELRREDVRQSIRTAVLMGRPMYYIGEPGNKTSTVDSAQHNPERAITRAQIASGEITDLPGTEKEVSSIQKILKNKRIETHVYIGKNATEESFKQSKADIIHVATHGFWFKPDASVERADAMFNSGLLFAGVKDHYLANQRSGSEDGILTAYELQGMNLDSTELVLLSACETALGHIETGEGVYGLQRALTIAGVDKIIMSLWKVDDQATQELFTIFYEYLVSDTYTITEAFQRAQAKMRTKYQSPYYWGAFVIID